MPRELLEKHQYAYRLNYLQTDFDLEDLDLLRAVRSCPCLQTGSYCEHQSRYYEGDLLSRHHQCHHHHLLLSCIHCLREWFVFRDCDSYPAPEFSSATHHPQVCIRPCHPGSLVILTGVAMKRMDQILLVSLCPEDFRAGCPLIDPSHSHLPSD